MSFAENKFETEPNVWLEKTFAPLRNDAFHKIDFLRARRDVRVGQNIGDTPISYALRAWTLEKGEARVVQVNLTANELLLLIAAGADAIDEVTPKKREDEREEGEDTVREERQEPAMAFEHRGGEWRHVSIPVRRAVVEEEKANRDHPTVGFLRVFRENEKTEELYGCSGAVDGQPVKVGGAPSAADAIRMFGNAVDAIKKLSKDRQEGTTPDIAPDIEKPETPNKGTNDEGEGRVQE